MSTGARKTRMEAVDNVEIHSTELEFCDATDLLTDMTAVIGPAAGAAQGGMANVGEAIAMFAREVVGGRLTGYLTRLLKCTTVIVKGDNAVKVSLLDSRDKLNKAFTGRQQMIFPAVKLALEVSFADFLGGLALVGLDMEKIKTLLSSGDSSPSTSATG